MSCLVSELSLCRVGISVEQNSAAVCYSASLPDADTPTTESVVYAQSEHNIVCSVDIFQILRSGKPPWIP